MDAAMDTSKVTSNGQVTIPIDFRKLLHVKPGNKVLFFQRDNGDVVIENASVSAIKKAQMAFSGAAEDFGYKTEEDVLDDIMRLRYEKQ
ncbi:MAG: AbrB/MazE/SpoVT family DNA-binding domain-containing protein [Coriobacteriales bacterium]|jgi:AbrB family looped-hinge helix DNA binding protein|nr:AbrB/MazE/SpoVT family DNA-binding domain-containing protein [Coriobacteriales bacterium]